MPAQEAEAPPPSTPLTSTQPSSEMPRAASFRPVSGVFHNTAEMITTNDGARYSRIAATDSEHRVWHWKYTMLSSRMLTRPEAMKMGRCRSLMRNTSLCSRLNTTVSTTSVPKLRTNTRFPRPMPVWASRRLDSPMQPQHTALRIMHR